MSQLALFSPSSQFLAVVGNQALKVWNVQQGKLQNEFRPAGHLAMDFTALAWGVTDTGMVANVEQDTLVAVGNSLGDVVLWNVATGEVQVELKKTNAHIQGSVRHIAINAAQTRLYLCSDSNSIVEFNLQTGTLHRTFACDSTASTGGFGRLALSVDGSKLLAAGTKIILWNVLSGTQVAVYQGHASQVCDLKFLSSGKYFISADADKFINVWSTKTKSSKTKSKEKTIKVHNNARLKLIASGNIHALHVENTSASRRGSSSNAFNICCLCSSGNVDLWQLDVKKEKNGAPKQAQGSIVCDAGRQNGTSNLLDSGNGFSDTGGIFALNSTSSTVRNGDSVSMASTSIIVCARGLSIQPQFETTAIEETDGSPITATLDFLDTAALLKSLQNGNAVGSGVGSSAAMQRDAHVLGVRDTSSSITGQKRRIAEVDIGSSSSKQQNDAKRRVKANTEPDSETLEERLSSLQRFTEKMDKGVGALVLQKPFDFSSGPTSLVTILQQALQANDRSKLEYCLAVHDKEIVTTTINKLPASCILPFLQQLVDRLEKSPRRGRVLIAWIRKILLRHTAYLMTVPDLAKELAALYEIIASRSALYTKFCRLSGRVDVLLAQLTHRKSLQLAAKQKPVIFEDGNDDEEDSSHSILDDESEDEDEEESEEMIRGDDDDSDSGEGVD